MGSYFITISHLALLNFHTLQLDNSLKDLVNSTCFSPLSDEKATPILKRSWLYSHQLTIE